MPNITTTHGVRVTVKPKYWPERSSPDAGQFAFLYVVEIANLGPEPAQLRSRHWVITDGEGHIEEVQGDGVVGKQPKLNAGESFHYSSWAILRTPYGSMRGSYQMHRPDGEGFSAQIGEFALSLPNSLN